MVEPNGASPDSSYDHLLTATGLHAEECAIREASAIEDDAASLVALEEEIVRLSELHLQSHDYFDFATAQLAATRSLFARCASVIPAEDELDAHSTTCRRVLGLGPLPEHGLKANLTRTMVAVTPFLRAQMVFPYQGEGSATSRWLSNAFRTSCLLWSWWRHWLWRQGCPR